MNKKFIAVYLALAAFINITSAQDLNEYLLGNWKMIKSIVDIEEGPLEGKVDLTDMAEEQLIFNADNTFLISRKNIENGSTQKISGVWVLSEDRDSIVFSNIKSNPEFKESNLDSEWIIRFKVKKNKLTLFRKASLNNLDDNSKALNQQTNKMVYVRDN
ncbi:hypothetical protein [Fulvivirga sp.]|uniref:hypothetical protein n=1 Tax=Fulvivirga sp. TaxID=1931237 RepID=UPI0032EE59E2